MVDLQLKIFEHANLCGKDCFEKKDDGSIENLEDCSVICCVGCGRKCHMECHRVPKSVSEGVKMVPRNNRPNALFGEFSYMRIVCENCANWLMIDVPPGVTPSFMVLFTRMAKKLIEENYTTKNLSEAADVGASNSTSARASRKRKKLSSDENVIDCDDHDLLLEMKDMLLKFTEKLDNIETGGKESSDRIKDEIVTLQKEVNDSYNGIESKISQVNGEINGMNICMKKIDGRFDSKHLEIENGLQKGFNSLWDKTEKFLSPRSHNLMRGNKIQSLRKQALLNTATAYQATPRKTSSGGGQGCNRSGSSTESIFGDAIPRRLFRSERKQFIYENAVVVSYVDPSITPKKMMNILCKNDVIRQTCEENETAIEIKRLTKRHMTEEDLKLLKFGVSYRIGANQEVFELLRSGVVFASHWEIRDWLNKDENADNDKDFGSSQMNGESSGLTDCESGNNVFLAKI